MNKMPRLDQEGEAVDSSIKTVVLATVEGVDGIERILHMDPAREAFFVYESARGGLRLLKVVPSERQGYKVQNYNLQDGNKNKSDVYLTSLTTALAKATVRRIGPEDAKALITAAKVKAVLDINWQTEHSAAPAKKPEIALLSYRELAKVVGSAETLEDWECLFCAMEHKGQSSSIQRRGITLESGTRRGGGEKVVITGKEGPLIRRLMADRDRIKEDAVAKLCLIKFLKVHELDGLAFKVLKPKVETPPEPEVIENKEQACVTVFVEKFNQEILRDAKGRLKRGYAGLDREVLLENFFLDESDLVLEIEAGIVMLDFSDKGASKLKSYWLGMADGNEVKMKWYQFKGNMSTQLETWQKEGIEFDFSALVEVFERVA